MVDDVITLSKLEESNQGKIIFRSLRGSMFVYVIVDDYPRFILVFFLNDQTCTWKYFSSIVDMYIILKDC